MKCVCKPSLFFYRKWDLNTLKCVKIFNGHQDTIVALDYCKASKQFASASLDRSCKGMNEEDHVFIIIIMILRLKHDENIIPKHMFQAILSI